jgi:ribonuclease M5
LKDKIDGIVIVEGKTDTVKLKKLFDVETIEVKGSSVKNIDLIKEASKNNKIILFLDPDGPGEKIRRKLEKLNIDFFQAFIKKTDIISGSKIGIAEATDSSIIKALKNCISFNNKTESISWEQYLSLNIDTKAKREKFCNVLKISYCNNKQLFNRMNMMGISLKALKKNPFLSSIL